MTFSAINVHCLSFGAWATLRQFGTIVNAAQSNGHRLRSKELASESASVQNKTALKIRSSMTRLLWLRLSLSAAFGFPERNTTEVFDLTKKLVLLKSRFRKWLPFWFAGRCRGTKCVCFQFPNFTLPSPLYVQFVNCKVQAHCLRRRTNKPCVICFWGIFQRTTFSKSPAWAFVTQWSQGDNFSRGNRCTTRVLLTYKGFRLAQKFQPTKINYSLNFLAHAKNTALRSYRMS